MPNPIITDAILDDVQKIYNSDFEAMIDEFRDLYPNTDIDKNQDHWVACLEYICNAVMLANKPMPNGARTRVPYCYTEFYENLAKKYSTLCRLHSRWIKPQDYLVLCGVGDMTDLWRLMQNEDKWVCSAWGNIINKLSTKSEESVDNKLYDSNSPVGQITIGNVRFGWSNSYNAGTSENLQIASSADDRANRLGLNIAQIEQKFE